MDPCPDARSQQFSASTIQSPSRCSCGLIPVLKTSWTDLNPGRRFWGCSLYIKNRRLGCNFHEWHDPPVCGRSRNIIPGLLKKVEKLEVEIKRKVVKEMKLKLWLYVALVVILMLSFPYLIA